MSISVTTVSILRETERYYTDSVACEISSVALRKDFK